MAYDAEILKELKKMNDFLEKIDWKIWNLHKKYIDEITEVPREPIKETPVEKDVEPVVKPAKYPTIETWE